MTTSELTFFKAFLRIMGTSALLAVFAVIMPYDSMNSIHQWLGLGELPDAPIVGYLARSTSAFYALLGGLMWLVSFDPIRHRTVLTFLGCAIIVLGSTLLAVDIVEGMPRYWIIWEGPLNILIGTTILYLARRGQ